MTFSGGSNFTPGVTQTVTVTVVDNAFPQFGFQTSPRVQGQDATAGAGTLIPVDADAQFFPATPPSTLSWIAAGEGAPAQVACAGITAPGLYQFNLTVPSGLSDGDAAVVATIGSVQTQAGAFIPVHN